MRTSFLLLIILLYIQALHAKEDHFTYLAPKAIIAEDTAGAWTLGSLLKGNELTHFDSIPDAMPNLGFTNSTWWVVVDIKNPDSVKNDFLLEVTRPLANEVGYYEIGEDGNLFATYRTGDALPFHSRPFFNRKFVFPLQLDAFEERRIMIRLQSDGEVLTLPLKLWDAHAFEAFTTRENLFLGIYYGLLLFVLVIFGFFALALKQKVYSYYVAYIFCLLLMQASLDGTAFLLLWPQNPWLANHSVLLFSAASVLLLMVYAAYFMKLSLFPGWYRKTFKAIGALVSLFFVASFFDGPHYAFIFPAINGVSLLALLTILAGLGWKWAEQKEYNLPFTLAFVSVLAGGLLFILSNANILFSEFLNENAIKIGSGLEVMFLSLAMAGRYREMQREKELAQQEALKNLQEINRITSEQKEKLEVLVEERTQEIRHKNHLLEEKNTEIIDSITYAKRLQQAILPSDVHFHELLPESFVLYLPKDIVAGDFYWIEEVETSEGPAVLYAACDCTGHGVPGALVSVVSFNALNRAVREFGLHKPAAILDKVNELVEETFGRGTEEIRDGMDIALVSVLKAHTQEGKISVRFAGANNPLWIVSNSKEIYGVGEAIEVDAEKGLCLFEIKGDKQPIGRYVDRKPFTNHQVTLSTGDMLYTFSDGFADQFGGPLGKKFKYKQLRQVLLSLNASPFQTQKTTLENQFTAWRAGLEQVDDVCVIGVKF